MKHQLWTALITPFDCHGQLDSKGLAQNIAFQKEQGVHGLVALGTTGEASTLTPEEKEAVIKMARTCDLPLMVGCTSNSTQIAIENCKQAHSLGADMALIAPPYYNKPTQQGIYEHFAAIANACPLPICVYNIPGRCSVTIEMATLEKLAALPTITALKDATGDLKMLMRTRQNTPCLTLFAGDDFLAAAAISIGANGLISVASNLIPGHMIALLENALLTKSLKLQQQLFPLFEALCLETNPIPIKWAMQASGLAAGSPRMPLTSFSPQYHQQLKEALAYVTAEKLIPTP